jgi:hypothetical protein
MKKVGLFLLAGVMVIGSASVSQAATPNMVGTWSGPVVSMCPTSPTNTLTGITVMTVTYQDGAMFSGDLMEYVISGVISGKQVQMNAAIPSVPYDSSIFLDGTYTATAGTIKGTYRDFRGCTGTFTIKKQ